METLCWGMICWEGVENVFIFSEYRHPSIREPCASKSGLRCARTQELAETAREHRYLNNLNLRRKMKYLQGRISTLSTTHGLQSGYKLLLSSSRMEFHFGFVCGKLDL